MICYNELSYNMRLRFETGKGVELSHPSPPSSSSPPHHRVRRVSLADCRQPRHRAPDRSYRPTSHRVSSGREGTRRYTEHALVVYTRRPKYASQYTVMLFSYVCLKIVRVTVNVGNVGTSIMQLSQIRRCRTV